jgi:hypothetical protein
MSKTLSTGRTTRLVSYPISHVLYVSLATTKLLFSVNVSLIFTGLRLSPEKASVGSPSIGLDHHCLLLDVMSVWALGGL